MSKHKTTSNGVHVIEENGYFTLFNDKAIYVFGDRYKELHDIDYERLP